MAEFSLKNNFEFETKITPHISKTDIGTKFVPPYPCFLWKVWKATFLIAKSHDCG